jgi:UDP-N-acetylmuramoyl-tripeptide--D-alanyl-D-alanine ligase
MESESPEGERSNGCVTVAWGGDVNLGRRFHYSYDEGESPAGLSTLAPLRDADVGIINLECVVATGGVQGIDKGERASYYYRARPEMLQALLDGGVDIVATANNHSGDYGPQALLEQAQWLDTVGIGYAGSGTNLQEALRPALRRVGDLSIAFFSIDATQASFAATANSPGHAYFSLHNPDVWHMHLTPLFQAARQQADIILVAVHWGANNKSSPGSAKIAVGHTIIDAGADAVLGSSAHMLQGIEIYRCRPIIHDAGDLFFDAIQRQTTDSGIFSLDIDGTGVRRIRFHPVEVGFCRSELLQGTEAKAASSRFAAKCADLGTQLSGWDNGEAIVLELNPGTRPAAGEASSPAAAVLKVVCVEEVKPPSAVAALRSPRPEWLAENVPAAVRLAKPVRLGPLALLGVRLAPDKLDARGSLFVESYWQLVEPTEENWRLDFLVHPDAGSMLGKWGASCDHDPCDWMWPTSRWQAGLIYRDCYALRPPAIRHWQDATLQLSVRLKTTALATERVYLPVYAPFSLNSQEAFAVLRATPPQYRVFPKGQLAEPPERLWSAEQLQQITGGRWLQPPPPGWFISSLSNKMGFLLSDEYVRPQMFVATDYRMVAKHELYSKLTDRHWDTHQSLPRIQSQLDGVIVAKPVAGLNPSLPVLQVADPMGALMELGVASRQRLSGQVVVITGSAGKTSLCGMLAQSMSAGSRVESNAANNYNSRCGILHLLANTPETTDLVVMETAVSAINSPGLQHIKLVRPDIAVITNIAPSHLPAEKTLSYVAQRKGNVIEGVEAGGWVVLYRETEYFDYLRDRAQARGLNVMTYGTGKDADIRLDYHDPVSGRVRAEIMTEGKSYDYSLRAEGLHMALNSLACIAVRKIIGKGINEFLPTLKQFESVGGRGKVHRIEYQGKKITLIDDSYNANPLSVKMALSSMRGKVDSSSRVLILGDMLELGDNAAGYHRDLADPIRALQPDRILLCGNLMKVLWAKLVFSNQFENRCLWFENVDSLADDLDQWLKDGDTVLVKGSNGVKLDTLVGRLVGGGVV